MAGATMVAAPLCRCLYAQGLLLRLESNRLRVSAPQLRFLSGKSLDRLRNGSSVNFNFQLTASADRHTTILDRDVEQFAVSFDLWEEKFSAVRHSSLPRTVSHLSAASTESWCVDNLSLNAAALPADRPLWIRLEVRAQDPADRSAVVGEAGINLARLIEIFSRPARAQETRFVEEAGPVRLADLKQQK